MFLKSNLFLIVSAMLVGLSAMAGKPLSAGQAGNYILDSTLSNLDDLQKNNHICPDFFLAKENLQGDSRVSLGALYVFETKNSKFNVDSDVLPGCQDIEENKRTDRSASETQLVRINETDCKDKQGHTKIRSKITMTATINPNKVELTYEMVGAEPYSCVWVRKP